MQYAAFQTGLLHRRALQWGPLCHDILRIVSPARRSPSWDSLTWLSPSWDFLARALCHGLLHGRKPWHGLLHRGARRQWLMLCATLQPCLGHRGTVRPGLLNQETLQNVLSGMVSSFVGLRHACPHRETVRNSLSCMVFSLVGLSDMVVFIGELSVRVVQPRPYGQRRTCRTVQA